MYNPHPGQKQIEAIQYMKKSQNDNSIEQGKHLKAENDELKTSLKKRCSARYKVKVKHREVTSLNNKNRYLKSRIEIKDKLLKRVRYSIHEEIPNVCSFSIF
jgi:predicted transcriptional regulator